MFGMQTALVAYSGIEVNRFLSRRPCLYQVAHALGGCVRAYDAFECA
jgi:hypothetical protein